MGGSFSFFGVGERVGAGLGGGRRGREFVFFFFFSGLVEF